MVSDYQDPPVLSQRYDSVLLGTLTECRHAASILRRNTTPQSRALLEYLDAMIEGIEQELARRAPAPRNEA